MLLAYRQLPTKLNLVMLVNQFHQKPILMI